MDLGRELVACVLREKTLAPFIEAGIGGEWLISEDDRSRFAIFETQDFHAWMTLADYWEEHGKCPSVDMFRRSHPAESYKLPSTDYTPAELIKLWREERQRHLTQVAVSDLTDLLEAGDVLNAVALMEHAARVIKNTYENRSIIVDWDDPDYDVKARIEREVVRGVMTGIPGLDSQFYGFQPGNLICYLGRAKAGKTSFALLSAMHAWAEGGKRVLFVSFEIAAGKLPSEPGIADRLDCFGAGVDLTRYIMGESKPTERRELEKFRAELAENSDNSFRIVQPTTRYTVTELEADIDRFKPDVVYIDGFYFMHDRITGKPGQQWEGHDNLANELKRLGMNRAIPIVLTHQVREKQLHGKKGAGIDDSAMMGGTAIIMYADLVLGVDVDDEMLRTVSCTRSRLKYLDTIHGVWDWEDCTFHEQAAPKVDRGQFGYGKEDQDELG